MQSLRKLFSPQKKERYIPLDETSSGISISIKEETKTVTAPKTSGQETLDALIRAGFYVASKDKAAAEVQLNKRSLEKEEKRREAAKAKEGAPKTLKINK